jgi:hypothetical protein
LLWAAQYEHLAIVQWLLREGGANIDERNVRGDTALITATQGAKLTIVQWLLSEGGANVAESNDAGWSSLLVAIRAGHLHIVQWLLREGEADINDTDEDGDGVWYWIGLYSKQRAPTPLELADMYSVLRCDSAPPNAEALIWTMQYKDEEQTVDLPAEHRDLLLQTERAHASPHRLPYRAQRLALLQEGTDFARVVIPDLQNIVLRLAQPTAEAQLSAAVIAEAEEADAHVRRERTGHNLRPKRNVRRRLE